LRQTDRFPQSKIGEATQPIIQSDLINSSNFLMERQISQNLVNDGTQSSFAMIGNIVIISSIISMGIIVVIVVFKFRSKAVSNTVSQLSDHAERELTGEFFTDIGYYHPSLNQIGFENPSIYKESIQDQFILMQSDVEESYWLNQKNGF
jgi:hypothetical protein